jgi:hypothetical protein
VFSLGLFCISLAFSKVIPTLYVLKMFVESKMNWITQKSYNEKFAHLQFSETVMKIETAMQVTNFQVNLIWFFMKSIRYTLSTNKKSGFLYNCFAFKSNLCEFCNVYFYTMSYFGLNASVLVSRETEPEES